VSFICLYSLYKSLADDIRRTVLFLLRHLLHPSPSPRTNPVCRPILLLSSPTAMPTLPLLLIRHESISSVSLPRHSPNPTGVELCSWEKMENLERTGSKAKAWISGAGGARSTSSCLYRLAQPMARTLCSLARRPKHHI
jgi:hypothetical protein